MVVRVITLEEYLCQKNLRIAYYLSRFPRLTETFILREMSCLRETGVDVQIYSLLPPFSSFTGNQDFQRMMPYVHYSPFLFSFKLIRAQFYFLFRSPAKYINALRRVIWQTWHEPETFIKTLALFPKMVYFSKQIEEMKVDHIHAHFVWISAIAAQVAADLTGIKYTLHAHAWDIFYRNRECVRRQLDLPTAIITVSEYHRQYLASLCPHRKPEDILVVHYGLDPLEFKSRQMPVYDHKLNIISVGRLVKKKGFEYLVDACAKLAEKGYSFRCSIVGDGPLGDSLQVRIDTQGLHNQVSLLGSKSQAEVKELYRDSDIFVLACVVGQGGDRDGMPNVLLEAMAMQIPVITTPVTGNVELVYDGENGLMVPERDSQALALAIEQLINDPSLRSRLGQQGLQTILAGFDIHHSASQLAGIFKEISESCA